MLERRLASLLTLLVVLPAAAACAGDGDTGDGRTSAAAGESPAVQETTPRVERGPAPDSTLTGEWWLRSFGSAAEVTPETAAEVTAIAERGSPLTLVVRGRGRVAGFSGCNLFMGSATGGGMDSLVFGPLASTRRACAEPNMGLETAYEAALARVRRYDVREGGTLVLSADDEVEAGPLLVFDYHGPPPERPGSTGGTTEDTTDRNPAGTP